MDQMPRRGIFFPYKTRWNEKQTYSVDGAKVVETVKYRAVFADVKPPQRIRIALLSVYANLLQEVNVVWRVKHGHVFDARPVRSVNLSSSSEKKEDEKKTILDEVGRGGGGVQWVNCVAKEQYGCEKESGRKGWYSR